MSGIPRQDIISDGGHGQGFKPSLDKSQVITHTSSRHAVGQSPMQGSLGASCQVETAGHRLCGVMFVLGISSSIITSMLGWWISAGDGLRSLLIVRRLVRRKRKCKGSGESLMNEFLETWTSNDIEALLVSEKLPISSEMATRL